MKERRKMKEILWHGRGGQGAFTASILLGLAYTVESPWHRALAFPSFGPERRGAPIRAFNRISEGEVGDRSEITKADYLLYLDDSLLGDSPWDELKENGIALVNTDRRREGWGSNVVTFDATGLAREILGLPVANTALLGFWAGISGEVSLDALIQGIRQGLKPKLQEGNIRVAEASFARGKAYVG